MFLRTQYVYFTLKILFTLDVFFTLFTCFLDPMFVFFTLDILKFCCNVQPRYSLYPSCFLDPIFFFSLP